MRLKRAFATHILFHSAENYERRTSAARSRHFGDVEFLRAESERERTLRYHFYSSARLRLEMTTRVNANLKAVTRPSTGHDEAW